MASGSDQPTNDVISVDNTFHPLDVTQRTDGDAEADWERWLKSLEKKTIDVERIRDVALKTSRLELLESGDLSDVTLICDDNELSCHRVILSESSPVFKAMFTTKMAEASAEDRRVEIQDVAFDVLRKVVKFLYADVIQVDGQDLVEILQFADMYQIDDLRKACGDMMLENISISSAVGIWQTAKKFQAKHIVEPARLYIIEKFYIEGEGQVGLSNGFMEVDKDVLVMFLIEPRLVIPSENQVFEVLWAWLMHKRERMKFLEELLDSCLHINMLDAKEVARCIQNNGEDALDEATTLTLYKFLKAVNVQHKRPLGILLPVRLETRKIQCLSLVFHTDSGVDFLAVIPKSENSVDVISRKFKKLDDGTVSQAPAAAAASRSSSSDEPVAIAPAVSRSFRKTSHRRATPASTAFDSVGQALPSAAFGSVGQALPSVAVGRAQSQPVQGFSLVNFMSQQQQQDAAFELKKSTSKFISSNTRPTLYISDNPGQLLLLSNTHKAIQKYDISEGTRRSSDSSFHADRLFKTHYGQLFAIQKLSYQDPSKKRLSIRRIHSEEQWVTAWEAQYDITVDSLELMAAYETYVIILEPADNRVSLFNSDTRRIERHYLQLYGNGENTAIASVANVAFLVHSDVIEVVYMDQLVNQLVKGSEASQKAVIIKKYPGPGAAPRNSFMTAAAAAEKITSSPAATPTSTALGLSGGSTFAAPPVLKTADVHALKTVEQASAVNMSTTEVEACAVLGDELLVMIRRSTPASKGIAKEAAEYRFEATNVNALLLLAAGERLEWKTLTLQHDDTSQQALHADWFKVELFNNVVDKKTGYDATTR